MVAHQASANPMYGPMSIELIERGYSPEEALEQLVRGDEGRDRRQNAIIDIEGRTAAWTGESTSDWAGHHCGVDYCAQGNILAGSVVVDAMVASFESSSGPLAERLMDALDAAQLRELDFLSSAAARYDHYECFYVFYTLLSNSTVLNASRL